MGEIRNGAIWPGLMAAGAVAGGLAIFGVLGRWNEKALTLAGVLLVVGGLGWELSGADYLPGLARDMCGTGPSRWEC